MVIIGRINNRPGFGYSVGASNKRTTTSDVAPSNPKEKDIWIDTTTNTTNRWDGATWISIGNSSNSSDFGPQ